MARLPAQWPPGWPLIPFDQCVVGGNFHIVWTKCAGQDIPMTR
jgi:hypothetical protein